MSLLSNFTVYWSLLQASCMNLHAVIGSSSLIFMERAPLDLEIKVPDQSHDLFF